MLSVANMCFSSPADNEYALLLSARFLWDRNGLAGGEDANSAVFNAFAGMLDCSERSISAIAPGGFDYNYGLSGSQA
jgi:hypothetical protein